MQDTLSIAKALADSNRMRVIAVLMANDELCVCQVTELLGVSTPTVSRHMSILYGARLVESRKAGRWVYYRLSATFPPLLRQWLTESLTGSAQVEADRTAVAGVLECDAGELCRCQRARVQMNR
jgi:ArsR family transcriptional regulator, arsenate/arsenite/antimonite-responsive transcriptional repressor